MGSLLVGLTFAKTLAWATGSHSFAVNHMLGTYAAHLAAEIPYPLPRPPRLGRPLDLCRVSGFDEVEVLGPR
jgi:N6-L-threonylcarbamoyladenine synthase